MSHSSIFFGIFSVCFSYFRYFFGVFFVFSGASPGWGILYFFHNFFAFPGFRGFWALYHLRRILIQEGFTVEPPGNDPGAKFQLNHSGLCPESQSYRPKVGVADPKVIVTAGQTPRIRTESPRKGPQMGFRCFYRNPP